jgi:hypothetical protein
MHFVPKLNFLLNLVCFISTMYSMGIHNGHKLNELLKNWPPGAVYTSSWLVKHGVSRDLLNKYRESDWVVAIGHGAVARSGDKVNWGGGIWAIQNQLGMKIHVGGKTALEMHGYAHFVPLGKGYLVYLFGPLNQKLPGWFKRYLWEVKPRHVMTNLFGESDGLGLTRKNLGTYSVTLSTPERAIMEALHLVPHEASFEGAKQLMEGLATLRPTLVQNLLERCHSLKVRRLFMYFAEKSNLPWVSKVDLSKVDFGKGKRVIVKGGRFDPKYQITVAV